MTMPTTEGAPLPSTILTLTVNNHAGVMSHICGLFSRRAYNLEGILCMPFGDGQHSRMWLRINEQDRFQQVCRQLEKMEDVLTVACEDIDAERMRDAMAYFNGAP